MLSLHLVLLLSFSVLLSLRNLFAEIVLLGVAAIRAQIRLEWDASAGYVTNSAGAQRFIGPGYDYRPGWSA